MKKIIATIFCLSGVLVSTMAGTKHSPDSQYPTYNGRVMAGYQGWFRAGGRWLGRWLESLQRARTIDSFQCAS